MRSPEEDGKDMIEHDTKVLAKKCSALLLTMTSGLRTTLCDLISVSTIFG